MSKETDERLVERRGKERKGKERKGKVFLEEARILMGGRT